MTQTLREELYLWCNPANPYAHIFTASIHASREWVEFCENQRVFLILLVVVPYLTSSLNLPYLLLFITAAKLAYTCYFLFYSAKIGILLGRASYLTWRMHPAQKDAVKAHK